MTGELERGTAERVMARAMELAGRDLTAGRGLTPDQLVAIGSELGIDEMHVRQALTEVLSAPPRVRALDRSVTAVRHVELTPGDCDRLLAAWFEEADGLRALRRTGPQLAIWAPRSGWVAGTRAAIARAGGADLDLRETKDVTTVIEPVGDASAVVRLEARVKRDNAVMAGVVGVGGAAAASVAMVAWMPLALGIPASLAAGYGFLRAQRRDSEMVAMALERRLDVIGAGHEPPVKGSPLTGAFGRMRTAAGRTRSAGVKR